jgi:hypothetical protein
MAVVDQDRETATTRNQLMMRETCGTKRDVASWWVTRKTRQM